MALGIGATQNKKPTLAIWDIKQKKLTQTIQEGEDNTVYKVNFNKNSTNLIYVMQNGEFFYLTMHDIVTGDDITLKKTRDHYYFMGYAIQYENNTLILPLENTGLEIWCIEKGTLLETININDVTTSVNPYSAIITTVSNNGKYLAMRGHKEHIIEVFNTNDFTISYTLDSLFQKSGQLVFSPNDKLLAAVSQKDGCFLWNTETKEKFLPDYFDEHMLRVHRVAFSRHSRLLAMGYGTSYVTVIDLDNGNEKYSDKLHWGCIHDIVITQDNVIYSAGEKGKLIERR